MKIYIVKRLENQVKQLALGELLPTHGVYADDDGLRVAVALCYNEPTADLVRDLLATFERECCGMGDDDE